MRIIWEHVEGELFFEVILDRYDELKYENKKEITGAYLYPEGRKTLNVMIRKEIYAINQGKKQRSDFGKYSDRKRSGKATKTSSSDCAKHSKKIGS